MCVKISNSLIILYVILNFILPHLCKYIRSFGNIIFEVNNKKQIYFFHLKIKQVMC